MPVPFGFSISDFISGINLIIDIVQSLQKTHGAQAGYQELGRELKNLNKGLHCIEDLSLDDVQPTHLSTVNEALKDCRLCVDNFLQRISGSSSIDTAPAPPWTLQAFREKLRKVQWALFKKADVATFRAEIQLHADAIDMLLATIQMQVNSSCAD
jgi:hypothetical protein